MSGAKSKTLPAFVHVDKVQLRFRMWFRDDLALLTGPDRTIIHNCILTYYLIDDSISVMEPRQENSGLPQGGFLKRSRVPRLSPGTSVGVGCQLRSRLWCEHHESLDDAAAQRVVVMVHGAPARDVRLLPT